MNNNEQLGAIFSDIAKILEILGDNVFKIRAYRNAAYSIMELDKDIINFYQEGALSKIPGITIETSRIILSYFSLHDIICEKITIEQLSQIKKKSKKIGDILAKKILYYIIPIKFPT